MIGTLLLISCLSFGPIEREREKWWDGRVPRVGQTALLWQRGGRQHANPSSAATQVKEGKKWGNLVGIVAGQRKEGSAPVCKRLN